jgi:hypothetical protein
MTKFVNYHFDKQILQKMTQVQGGLNIMCHKITIGNTRLAEGDDWYGWDD